MPREGIPCTQANPSGLKYGLLVECARLVPVPDKGHTGKHQNARNDMQWWGGKLSETEMALADFLRERKITELGKAWQGMSYADRLEFERLVDVNERALGDSKTTPSRVGSHS